MTNEVPRQCFALAMGEDPATNENNSSIIVLYIIYIFPSLFCYSIHRERERMKERYCETVRRDGSHGRFDETAKKYYATSHEYNALLRQSTERAAPLTKHPEQVFWREYPENVEHKMSVVILCVYVYIYYIYIHIYIYICVF